MALFGEDPKDLVIQELRSERDYLRAKVDELQRELLAMTSSSAYRLVHKDAPEPPPFSPQPPSPIQLRNTIADKSDLRTQAEVKADWGDS
jgi:hypothetical protein